MDARVGVVTVDDQALFRGTARDVIDATPGFEAVGEASSGQEALGVVADVEPELVLLDVRMPDMDGVQTARRIKDRHPDVVVVLISIQDEGDIPASAESCGAAEFVRKQDFGPRRLRSLWEEHGAKA